MRQLAKILPLSLIFSVAIHLLIMGIVHLKFDKQESPKNSVVEIEYLNVKKEKKKQIVQQDKRVNDKRPSKESFLGKFDQNIDEQMQASKSGETKDTAGGGQMFPQQRQVETPTQKPKEKVAKKGNWKKLKLSDLKPKFDWAPEDNKNQAAFVGEESQSSDYLENIKKGNQNLLNTREFKFYTYFNRIRTQLQQYWEPSIQGRLHKLLRSGRKIASAGPKTTKILITLNNQGLLVAVQVLEDSGLRDLDEAAIEAFKKAAPFPNPPNGIIEKDGTVKIRWDFVLEA